MKCPICNTINLVEQSQCYHCNADLTLLRSIILRAKEHFNRGLEHAERGRLEEAIVELKVATSLYHDFPEAYNVMGTLYAKQEKFELAIEQWQNSLDLDPVKRKAADYMIKAKNSIEEPALRRKIRYATQLGIALSLILAIMFTWQLRLNYYDLKLNEAKELTQTGHLGEATTILQSISTNYISASHRSLAKQQTHDIIVIISGYYQKVLDLISSGNSDKALSNIYEIRKRNLPVSWDNKFKLMQTHLIDEIITSSLIKTKEISLTNDDYQDIINRLESLKKYPLNKKQLQLISSTQKNIEHLLSEKQLNVLSEPGPHNTKL